MIPLLSHSSTPPHWWDRTLVRDALPVTVRGRRFPAVTR
jgi:hypothetical protein